MEPSRGSAPPPSDPDDGHGAWRPSMVYLVLALGLGLACAGFVLYTVMSAPGDAVDEVAKPVASPAKPAVHVSANSNTAAAWPPAPAPEVKKDAMPKPIEGDADPTRDLSSYVPRGAKPSVREVIERLHQAGVYSGIGAFSPPGTRPPLVGLAVPEDFVLPPGYVRHYQATDDGQRIEAILMFAPDHPLVDAANRPIDIPKDRVVPPELAPPGLPIRRIVVPAPIDAGR